MVSHLRHIDIALPIRGDAHRHQHLPGARPPTTPLVQQHPLQAEGDHLPLVRVGDKKDLPIQSQVRTVEGARWRDSPLGEVGAGGVQLLNTPVKGIHHIHVALGIHRHIRGLV